MYCRILQGNAITLASIRQSLSFEKDTVLLKSEGDGMLLEKERSLIVDYGKRLIASGLSASTN